MNGSQQRQIVLVEPCGGMLWGHPVEKLLLWCNGVLNLKFEITVVTWDRPRVSLPGSVDVITIPPSVKLVHRLVSTKQRPKHAEFWTYRRAFDHARKLNCAVLGLTASSPIPIAAAAALACPRARWGQIVMYGGLVDTPTGIQIRPRARWAFQQLLNSGCHLLCNAPLTADMLTRINPARRQIVHHLPDPIDVPGSTGAHKGGERRILVPGQDDHRRTPLWHLTHLQGPGIDQVIVHEPGKTTARLRDGTEWSVPPTVRQVQIISDYLAGERLTSLFADATATMVAYSEDFLQGSANLALSIVCGTPVLCTRFPYAAHLAKSYGRIGEFFKFGDTRDFNAAFQRLTEWQAVERAEFQAARERLMGSVDHRVIIREALTIVHSTARDETAVTALAGKNGRNQSTV